MVCFVVFYAVYMIFVTLIVKCFLYLLHCLLFCSFFCKVACVSLFLVPCLNILCSIASNNSVSMSLLSKGGTVSWLKFKSVTHQMRLNQLEDVSTAVISLRDTHTRAQRHRHTHGHSMHAGTDTQTHTHTHKPHSHT